MIIIVDYGMGNLRSVQKAIERIGGQAVIADSSGPIEAATKLILPGVGAFGDAMEHLRQRKLIDPIRRFIDTGRPMLGICLGLQLLFEHGEEDGGHAGLGIIPGNVVRFQPTDHALKVPHMGWNAIAPPPGAAADLMLAGVKPGSHVYFVHSYYAVPRNPADIALQTDYGGNFCAAIRHGNIFATQFHPEKSQAVGMQLLSNFAKAG